MSKSSFSVAECLPLPDIANGMISYAPDMSANYTVGTEATYTCDSGFQLALDVGNEVRTCVEVEPTMSGARRSEFNGTAPRCECKSCE